MKVANGISFVRGNVGYQSQAEWRMQKAMKQSTHIIVMEEWYVEAASIS